MGIYRRIEVHTWVDTKFKNLSPIKPSGQALWFYLLTGPQTGIIPGLFKAGHAAMAEDLGWSSKDFEEAFGEVLREGLAKDSLKDRLIWIPNAIKYDPPTSPNVIRSWASAMDTLPECVLLREAIEYMRVEVYLLDKKEVKGFAKAFDEVFGKALGKDFGKALPKGNASPSPNQEQEQDQKQKQYSGAVSEKKEGEEPPAAAAPSAPAPDFSKNDGAEKKSEKEPFGKFKHVFLTRVEYNDLIYDYGSPKTIEYINRLDYRVEDRKEAEPASACARLRLFLEGDKVPKFDRASERKPESIAVPEKAKSFDDELGDFDFKPHSDVQELLHRAAEAARQGKNPAKAIA